VTSDVNQILRLVSTGDPQLAALRVSQLHAVGLLALKLRDARTDLELAEAVGAICDTAHSIEWLLLHPMQ
jgi:hypothetical protein